MPGEAAHIQGVYIGSLIVSPINHLMAFSTIQDQLPAACTPKRCLHLSNNPFFQSLEPHRAVKTLIAAAAALWHSMAQHSTAQHSTAQHSTAQHSSQVNTTQCMRNLHRRCCAGHKRLIPCYHLISYCVYAHESILCVHNIPFMHMLDVTNESMLYVHDNIPFMHRLDAAVHTTAQTASPSKAVVV